MWDLLTESNLWQVGWLPKAHRNGAWSRTTQKKDYWHEARGGLTLRTWKNWPSCVYQHVQTCRNVQTITLNKADMTMAPQVNSSWDPGWHPVIWTLEMRDPNLHNNIPVTQRFLWDMASNQHFSHYSIASNMFQPRPPRRFWCWHPFLSVLHLWSAWWDRRKAPGSPLCQTREKTLKNHKAQRPGRPNSWHTGLIFLVMNC